MKLTDAADKRSPQRGQGNPPTAARQQNQVVLPYERSVDAVEARLEEVVRAPAARAEPPRSSTSASKSKSNATSTWFVLATFGLGVLFSLVYQLGVPLRSTYGSRINVDEPFYLLTTVSLLDDGDINLANDYALRRFQAFFDQPELWTQSVPTSDGRLLSPHDVGLSILVLPGYALGGLDGAKASLGIVGGITVLFTALLAERATRRRWASLLAAAVLGATAPMFVYATQIYPEMAAAALVAFSVWLLLGVRPGVGAAAGLAVSLTALAWLGSKYIPLGSVIAALGLMRLRPRVRAGLVAALAVSGLAYVVFHLASYGGLTPYSLNRLYAGDGFVELLGHHVEITNRLYRLLGLWVDAEFGLVRWAPVLLLVLVAAPRPEYGAWLRFARSRRLAVFAAFRRAGAHGKSPRSSAMAAPTCSATARGAWRAMAQSAAEPDEDRGGGAMVTACWLAPVVTQIVVAVFLSITMRGWWFPGRMLIVVLPLLAIPLASGIALSRRRPVLAIAAVGLAVYSIGITVALVRAAADGEVALAVDPFSLAWPPFRDTAAAFPLYTDYSVTTLVLSAIWLGVAVALVCVGLAWRGPWLHSRKS